jgi:hypothetical protein
MARYYKYRGREINHTSICQIQLHFTLGLSKIDHHLKIVDFYIHSGMPEIFIPEPNFKNYKPDVYMKDKQGNPICVEIQLTPISTKRMQVKMDEFVSTHGKEHDAKIMLLVSNNEYGKVTFPSSFKLVRIPIPDEPYTEKRA